MTPAQVLYPFIAAAEVAVLAHLRYRRPHAQNEAAILLWLRVQLVIFCVLEPMSVLGFPHYARYFFVCSVVSSAADLVMLYAIFFCLEDGFRAFGSVKAWGSLALLSGLFLAFAAGLPMPWKAHRMDVIWMSAEQALEFIRITALICLALYGWLRASSWPSDLAWTWLAMAAYSFTQAIVFRVQIVASNTNLLELVTSLAALAQLAGFWRALCYAPKPLTPMELEAARTFLSKS